MPVPPDKSEEQNTPINSQKKSLMLFADEDIVPNNPLSMLRAVLYAIISDIKHEEGMTKRQAIDILTSALHTLQGEVPIGLSKNPKGKWYLRIQVCLQKWAKLAKLVEAKIDIFTLTHNFRAIHDTLSLIFKLTLLQWITDNLDFLALDSKVTHLLTTIHQDKSHIRSRDMLIGMLQKQCDPMEPGHNAMLYIIAKYFLPKLGIHANIVLFKFYDTRPILISISESALSSELHNMELCRSIVLGRFTGNYYSFSRILSYIAHLSLFEVDSNTIVNHLNQELVKLGNKIIPYLPLFLRAVRARDDIGSELKIKITDEFYKCIVNAELLEFHIAVVLLQLAIMDNKNDAVKRILHDETVDVVEQNINGNNALTIAAMCNNAEAMHMLLDTNPSSISIDYASYIARHYRSVDIIRILQPHLLHESHFSLTVAKHASRSSAIKLFYQPTFVVLMHDVLFPFPALYIYVKQLCLLALTHEHNKARAVGSTQLGNNEKFQIAQKIKNTEPTVHVTKKMLLRSLMDMLETQHECIINRLLYFIKTLERHFSKPAHLLLSCKEHCTYKLLSLTTTHLKGKGYDTKLSEGISPMQMSKLLTKHHVKAQIILSTSEKIIKTLFELKADTAFIELVGDCQPHWIAKIILDQTITIIYPGQVPHDILISCRQAEVTIISVPQLPGQCAQAALDYVIKAVSQHTSTNTPTSMTHGSTAPHSISSDSLLDTIIDYVKDQGRLWSSQLKHLESLIEQALEIHSWFTFTSNQLLQLKILLSDVRASLYTPVPVGKPDGDPNGDNYGNGPDDIEGQKNNAQDNHDLKGISGDNSSIDYT